MNTKPEIVVFDLGGVLIEWNPRYLYRKIFADEKEMEFFLTEICSMEFNAELDAGRDFAEATNTLAKKFPQYREPILAYDTRWLEMMPGPIPGTVRILESLFAHQIPLYAITNWSHQTFPYALENYAFLQYFKDIIVSGQEKIIKPNPLIYQILIDRHQLKPETCLFIDDNPMNVQAAIQQGMQSVQYQDPETLHTDLLQRDFPV